jgi:hypothetical protein
MRVPGTRLSAKGECPHVVLRGVHYHRRRHRRAPDCAHGTTARLGGDGTVLLVFTAVALPAIIVLGRLILAGFIS